ncbi:MAG: glycoside hydrolase family 3 C-terminal domain-containing protein, partial [Ferruginibacter sp.]
VGMAMGSEVKAYGVDILLAPALNIQRNPLGGRNFEYYSEDPVIAGNIAAAMVNGIESNGVGTSIKHFAGNNQETNRNLVNTIVSERALREIYLKGFEIAVKKSQPWTVMSSYNKLNGAYTSEEYDLLSTILRKEWGFKGLVMTDWFGGKDPVAQMKAGNDLLMPGTPALEKSILNAVNNGSLDIKIVEENVERILNIIFQTPSYKKSVVSNRPNLKANALVARAAASEGMILLKNEGSVLPLNRTIKKIAAFGNTSYDFIAGGTGSGDVNVAYTVSLVEGLSNAGFVVEKELKNRYEQFIVAEKAKQPKKKFFFELPAPLPEMEPGEDLINQKAAEEDIAFITIGRNAGEFQDRKKENDYYLSEAEIQLIKKVSAAFHAKNKKLVVILNVGGVVDVTSWNDDADAILLSWQGGQEAGNAVADILGGKVNPSGKLTATFPVSYDDVPSAKNFPGKNLSKEEEKGIGGFSMGFESEVVYEEGIYVGYRYYNTFGVKPAYPFGFGLSYTNFRYGNMKLSSATFNGKITISVDITNT